jgi:hypothetical protein
MSIGLLFIPYGNIKAATIFLSVKKLKTKCDTEITAMH